MLDRRALKIIKPTLATAARSFHRANIKADHITVTGFAIGMLALPAIALEYYALGAMLILLNRLCDGLDGEVARLSRATNRGAYLDIVLDFIFYSAIVFAFALANPSTNALPAAALIFSFMGTGSSFLAFAILAERLQLSSMHYPNKGFYYLNGITEGTETILFLLSFCLFPSWFAPLAWVFFTLCVITTITRVIGGAHTLKHD
ncbi:CDP-alcohol phosphatidyltransferase family protein [Reinekea sp. G2M2-21]|uniref:CDP-alcohol phosphatidyltransferase family protein n=1 Tax=Reinekea sp. G2M2-21 TaxID=2788942 RepID=UPI0018A9B4F4|nr:CDP-alcohol phosphatidyltransferase family protein [Reinekea sp. G2M2-21]